MNSKMKRNLSILCAVILSASTIIGGTIAYFSDAEERVNPFTTAGNTGGSGVDIDLEEPNWDPDDAEDMFPGSTITKDPTIINTEGPVYTRFIVEFIDKDTQNRITGARALKIQQLLFHDVRFAAGQSPTSLVAGTSYAETAYPGATILPSVGTQLMRIYNSAQFTLDTARGGSGLYYYNYTAGTGANQGVLATGGRAVLFTHVVIPANWNQTDLELLGNFDIVVKAQAIQTANMPSLAAAMTALDTEQP